MIEQQKYNAAFFKDLESSSQKSAREVLPIINEMIKPGSVVDIGCGTGEWLQVWNSVIGLTDIAGVEGPYLDKSLLKIPNEKMIFQDLKEKIQIDRTFDLAMSLEVAEHLPLSRAEFFVG